MRYFSTRNTQNITSAADAIVRGLSQDGGLFVPESFPKVDLASLIRLEYHELASKIIGMYLTDYSEDFLRDAASKTYGEAFGGKAGNTVKVEDGLYSLELWHGPTCAFKDYALQIMPKLLVEAKKMLKRDELTKILVATSGDTGKAALDGYHDLPGIEIAVFYPNSGTSEIQRMQMATQQGENVSVWAIQGNFDDAQTGVKKVFGDKELAKKLEDKNIRLSSANSINWGRLVPQIVYYFYSYCCLVRSGEIKLGDKINFCVPTGNFGDILAGYYAMQMGLPVHKLICASNKNDVLTDFFETGVYNANREFYKTTSPSMDILVSSNLERLLYHITQNDKTVASYMNSLSTTGMYQVENAVKSKIDEIFAAGCAADEEGSTIIKTYFEKYGYLCDTHTAVAFDVAQKYRDKTGDETLAVIVSTASPYKFPCAVLTALGKEVPENEFEAMHLLEEISGSSAPAGLARLNKMAERFNKVIPAAEIADVALGNLTY